MTNIFNKQKIMKNNSKLFEKRVDLKTSGITGGIAQESYTNTDYSYTDSNGCHVVKSTITNDKNQVVQECYFQHCN